MHRTQHSQRPMQKPCQVFDSMAVRRLLLSSTIGVSDAWSAATIMCASRRLCNGWHARDSIVMCAHNTAVITTCTHSQGIQANTRPTARSSRETFGRSKTPSHARRISSLDGNPQGLSVRCLSASAGNDNFTRTMLPLQAYGQVMSASSNMVRVDLSIDLYKDFSADQQHLDTQTEADGSSTACVEASQHATHLPRSQLLCSMRTLLKKLEQTVLVGDQVRVGSIDWNEGRGQVEAVLPRKSELTDPAIANVDFALLVFALNNPPFEEVQVTRFLVSMEASGIPFRLVLNKADLVSPQELTARIEQVRSWGYEPLVVSCEGEGQGLNQVLAELSGKTSVVAGPSGAGKSSLINAIRLGRHKAQDMMQEASRNDSNSMPEYYGSPPINLPPSVKQSHSSLSSREASPSIDNDTRSGVSDVEDMPSQITVASRGGVVSSGSLGNTFLAVGDLNRVGRGKHTTTAVTLIKLPTGGSLADTPGFSQPSLDGIASTELATYFPEFQQHAEASGGCQFKDCQHLMEPGCCINSQDPPLERHIYYAKFLFEIKEREETDIVLQAGKKSREGKAKLKTDRGGRLRAEIKLDSSKHRRSSRTRAKQAMRNIWDEE